VEIFFKCPACKTIDESFDIFKICGHCKFAPNFIDWDDVTELSSSCSEFENKVMAQSLVIKILRQDELYCPKCELGIIQIQFQSNLNYIHWFCGSYGKDFTKESQKQIGVSEGKFWENR